MASQRILYVHIKYSLQISIKPVFSPAVHTHIHTQTHARARAIIIIKLLHIGHYIPQYALLFTYHRRVLGRERFVHETFDREIHRYFSRITLFLKLAFQRYIILWTRTVLETADLQIGMSHRHVRQIWMDRLSDHRDWVLPNGMKRISLCADHLERAKRAE